MKHSTLTAFLCLGTAAFAQEVHFDYDRSANFANYKTYQWVDYKPVDVDLSSSSQAASRLRQWPASSSRIDTHPRYSPDGSRVAFMSTRSGTDQIWLADADGSSALQLTSMTATFVDQPSWSPDGNTIVFRAFREGHFEFYTISGAGGTPKLLMRGSTGDGWPTLSANGRWIYFNSKRAGSVQIWREAGKRCS